MKIGIISDTHDAYKNTSRAVEIFKEKKVDYILHAGDMVSSGTAEMFAEVEGAKFIAVFGNCDVDKDWLIKAIESFGGEIHEESYAGTIGGKKVFMVHKLHSIEETAESGEYDLVVYGHTHRLDVRRFGKTMVVNPGTMKHWLKGKAKVVVVEIGDMSTEVVAVG